MNKKDVRYTYIFHTMQYYSAIKKNKTLPSATTHTDLQGIILCAISKDRERHILYDFNYMYNLKSKTTTAKQKQS